MIERASLTIWPGDRITLVGSNGAGKTTLLEAFLLFIEPQSGRMTVGDTEVSAVPAGGMARTDRVAAAATRACSRGRSPRTSRSGGRDAGRAAVERAAGLAGAAEFIASLPDGVRHSTRRTRAAAVGRRAPQDRAGPAVLAGRTVAAARRADRASGPGERGRGRGRDRRAGDRAHRGHGDASAGGLASRGACCWWRAGGSAS